MSHLRRYLEQTAAVAPERLEAALRRQQIYGGSLDTVLLELSVCDPQTLCELLSQACGLDVVRPELLENRPRPWDAVPDSLQDIGWAVPLAEEEDGSIIVAVHPDLPNERLGELYRAVGRVVPLVTPECGLEKVNAERTASVVPQRYAVLFASFMAALRQRPSVSDIGFPILPVPPEDTDVGRPIPAPPAEPPEDLLDLGPNPERSTQPYGDDEDGSEVLDEPEAAQTHPRAKIVRPPSFGPPRSNADTASSGPVQSNAPPIRFTARGTMIATSDPLHAAFDPAAARRGVDAARSKLAEATTRDEAVDALIEGALALSERVAVFRIRGAELLGLSTPHPALAGLHDVLVPVEDIASDLLGSRRWVGTTGSGALAAAVGTAHMPCTMHRIDVAGRPVLVLYVDHEGREFLPTEANMLDELCESTAAALESILRRRRSGPSPAARSADVAPIPPPPEPLTFTPPALEPTPRRPEPAPAPQSRTATRPPAVEDSTPLLPPPAFGTTEPPGWPPPPEPLEGTGDGHGHDPAEAMQRPTQVDGSPPAVAVPNPPAERSGAAGPRFVPPVLDEADDGGIIPLASPIDQPTIRGRILIDDEELDEPWSSAAVDRVQQRIIDDALHTLARDETRLEDLRELGEAGLRGLASQLPGPLEVLRRDLRALPAPSAHGPLVRAAIRLGAVIVPYVLEQFESPDPDLRFYAAFLFQELRDPRAMLPLSQLAFDGSTDVRVVSMRVLETYSRYEGYDDATAVVRGELDSPHRTRQLYAARAVGTLRDVEALPRLIDLLSSPDRFIQEAALESLCSVTGQQHGLKPHRWKAWHEEQGDRHRVEWIIESLRHRDLPVRRWAHDELVRVTGHRVPFSPLGDRKSREVAHEAWSEWWQRHGHVRLSMRVGTTLRP